MQYSSQVNEYCKNTANVLAVSDSLNGCVAGVAGDPGQRGVGGLRAACRRAEDCILKVSGFRLSAVVGRLRVCGRAASGL